MYKIFINDKPFILSKTALQEERFKDLVHLSNPEDIEIMKWVRDIEGMAHKGILIQDPHPKLLFDEFRTHFISIEAGGGLVFNEQQEILLIKRLGKWDLPKGKIDPGESNEQAAIREVEEECGINKLKILAPAGNSYHTYKLQGHRFLKITYWFFMKTEFVGVPVPQTEENITEVKWFNWKELNPLELDTYQSIREVLMDAKQAEIFN